MNKRARLDSSSSMAQQHQQGWSSLDNASDQVFAAGPFPLSSRDVSKLMLKTLKNLGLRETAAKLEEESGLRIISETAQQFLTHIRSGEWDLAMTESRNLEFTSISTNEVVVMLVELKYFELIDNGHTDAALLCLRNELSSIIVDMSRLSSLAAFLLDLEFKLCDNNVRMDDGQRFYRTRDALIANLRSHLSPNDLVSEFRLEDLMGKALLWESSSIDSRSHSNDHRRRRYPPIKSSLLKDMYVGLPLTVATSIRLHAILELCHSSEVWCVAFSPNGAMLATATLDGSVKLWLPGHNNAALSRSVECRGAACEPLLLRWNKVSSSFLCCCRNDHLIYEWNIGSVVEDETLTVLECCRQYDQSFRIVFADFLPNANPSLPDLVVSCTAENHIFLCDASNKPLATFVGGEGTVSSATLISTIPVRKCNSMNADNKSHGLGSFQDLGWRPCGERGSGVRESASLSLGLTTSFKSTSIHNLLVANSKHDDVKLFQVVVSGSVSGPTYEIISISRLSIGLPVISLARFMNCKDESIGGMEPVAIAVLHGGSIVTINLQQEGTNPRLSCSLPNGCVASDVNADKTMKVAPQSRYVIKPSMDPRGHFIACGGEDGLVRVWDGSLGDNGFHPPHLLLGHCGNVSEVSWWSTLSQSRNSQPSFLLASASDDCTVRVWAPENYTCPSNLGSQSTTVPSMQILFSGDIAS